MEIATFMVVIIIFATILIPIGAVLLQIYLSRKQNKWLGLILPAIPFCYSFLVVLSFSEFAQMSGSSSGITIFLVLISANFPTAILLLIYFICRRGIKPRAQLNKMNIQDLD